ncbi:CorA family divalent cation transporter [Dyadobacter subterraneus]|uniref:Magnesium transporter CorA n=1 Tax=Dyadobacter subterraneus TaxID=2773304 RepID=A0ABR9WCJ8_9BACT|nr:CorA family divalent cation transporter [Dyadobacter subterraneus]MBE9463200.1 magnesium transporter CorA [Dyadobacter subterraneus]
MIKTFADKSEHPFEWLDVTDPSMDELHEIAKKYNLHESSVNDCLQPDHLPKYEIVGNEGDVFIILRLHTSEVANQADTVRELTDKIAIFMKEERVITIHKKPWPESEKIKDEYIKSDYCKSAHHILNEIVKTGLATYDQHAARLNREIEFFETNMFLKNRKRSLLEGLYYLKRKVDVTRRILILTFEIVDKIDNQPGNTYTRDTRDLYVKLHNIYDTLFENTNHLLTIYFSLSSQRTNEIIRVLTIFSVFFMPLTFIVGIYGMNFEHMPELKMRFGYPGVMLLMGVVTGCIYYWFKKREWL